MAWDPKKDPIVGGNTATGERYTKSGRVISSQGNVVTGRRAPGPGKTGDYGKTGGSTDHMTDSQTHRNQGEKAKSAPGAGKPGPMKPSDYKEMQQILVKYGYAIGDVDGKWGPRSKAAWTNYKSARKNGLDIENAANYWSEHSRYSKGFVPPNNRTDGKPGGAGSSAAGASTAATDPEPTGSPYASIIADLFGQFGIASDPNKLAQAAANTEYDAQITGVQKEIQDAKGRATQAQLDIGKWFDQALASVKEGGAADQKASAAVVAGQDEAMQNLMASIEDPAAKYALGKTAGYNRANLAGMGASEGIFDRNILDSIVMRGGEEKMKRSREDADYGTDLVSKLGTLFGEKGQKTNLYREQFKTSELQRKSGLLDQIGVLSMLPTQVEGAGLANENAFLNNRYTEAKIASEIAAMKEGPENTLMQPGNSARRQVSESLVNYGMGLKESGAKPNDVVSYINGILKSNGVQPKSALGIALRGGALRTLGAKVGPGGNPVSGWKA